MTDRADRTAPDLPQQREGLLGTDVADEHVVVDPRRGRAHRLNPSALAVWNRLDGTRSAAAIAGELADRYGVDASVTRADVDRLVDELQAEGLLDDGTEVPTVAPAAGAGWLTGAPIDDAPTPVAAPHRTRAVRVLATTVRFATSEATVAAALDELLAPLAVDAATTDREWSLVGIDAMIELRSAAGVLRRAHTWPDAVRQVVIGLNAVASFPDERLLTLHAAGVVVEGRGVALPGTPESGKSTLVTALTRAGHRYLGDEALGLTGDGRLVPFPKPIALDRGSWPLFEELRPDRQAAHDLVEDGLQWLVDPGAVGPGVHAAPDERPHLDLVILPRYLPDAPTTATRLAPADALMALLPNVFNLAHVGAEGLTQLRDLATAVPVHELVVDDLDAAVDAVVELAASVGPP